MILTLGSVWSILTPVTIVTTFINVIPFVIHLRLGNWPGLFLTVMFIIYGILTSINGIINRTLPVTQILLLPNVYWFCSIYDIVLPIIKVATSGCCLRLLTHLMVILQKAEVSQQNYTQQHYSTATILTNISGTLSTLLPSYSVIVTTNRRPTWKKRISNAVNRMSLWYQDHHGRIWDILFIWVFPILYMVSLVIFDERFSEGHTYDTPIRYLHYSPAAGCLLNKYEGLLVSTIYYVFPLIILGAGVFYTVLIAIKFFKLRPIFASATPRFNTGTGNGLNRPTFYRLFLFCCLYNLLYLAHVPNAIFNYMTVIMKGEILWSEQDIIDSKNGLTLITFDKVEVIMLVVYPLLAITWAVFFGMTQEARDIYASVWRWIQHYLVDRQQQREDDAEEVCMDPVLYQTSTLTSTSSIPSTVFTLVPPKVPLIKDCIKPPLPASLSSRSSSLCHPISVSLYSTYRHTFSSIPSLPGRPNLFARHSIHSATGTVSSRTTDTSATTLVNPS